jgi:chromosome partitioning protein
MITLTELSRVLDLSKERAKQLVDEALLKNPKLTIEKGSIWKLGEDLFEEILKARGKEVPKRKVITLKSQKGGVTGTTLLLNSSIFSSRFFPTLVLDFDPECHATNFLLKEDTDLKKIKCIYDIFSENRPLEDGIIPSKYPNLDILPSALRVLKAERLLSGQNPKKLVREKIDKLIKNYGIIFIDLPPSLSTLVGSSYLAADLIVLPCIPSVFSLESIGLTIESIEKLAEDFDVPERNYKIIFNLYNPKRVASQEVLSALLNNYNQLVYPFFIKENSQVLNSLNAGKSVFELKGSKNTKEDFTNFSLSLMGFN